MPTHILSSKDAIGNGKEKILEFLLKGKELDYKASLME